MTRQPPLWALVLEAAREWGVPPWTIEEECSRTWWEWWLADRDERLHVAENTKRRLSHTRG